jgi:hypothetical protein
MGFYGSEPFDTATCVYVSTGLGGPGFFAVDVKGEAPKYTTGIQLVQDPHWVGGLKVDVMGWTGPLGEGTMPFEVRHSFPGEFVPKVTIAGKNKTELVDVTRIPDEQAEDFMQQQEAAVVA